MATSRTVGATVGALRSRIAGLVVAPDDAEFDVARTPSNLASRHRPSFIVFPDSSADVAVTVRFVAGRGLGITIQSAGHGIEHPADGTVLIVLSRLATIVVDADAWTAQVGAGATCAAVTAQAQHVDLAPLLGPCPSSSAVGSVLGGGMGWLARRYGLGADRVRRFEIVTADGAIHHASADEEPELFWALQRSGAGAFGVVTAMEIDLAPIRRVYAGELYYPAEMAVAVGARYRQWTELVPDEMSSALTILGVSAPRPTAGALDGAVVAVRGCYTGPDTEGEALLRFWRAWHTPVLDRWRPTTFGELSAAADHPIDPAWRITTSDWLSGLAPDLVRSLSRSVLRPDRWPALDRAEIRHGGGAGGSAHSPALGGERPGQFLLTMAGTARGPVELSRLRTLGREIRRRLVPGVGRPIQRENRARLEAVERSIDPGGVFRTGPRREVTSAEDGCGC